MRWGGSVQRRQSGSPYGSPGFSTTGVEKAVENDPATGRSESIDPQVCQELRAMMILLYRLEASSSEDLGVEGLRRLWHQHGEIMARYGQQAH